MDVNVTKANSASANYTLKAQLGSADAVNTWAVGGTAVTSAAAATITATGAYATNVNFPVALTVPFATAANTAISNTLNFTAAAQLTSGMQARCGSARDVVANFHGDGDNRSRRRSRRPESRRETRPQCDGHRHPGRSQFTFRPACVAAGRCRPQRLFGRILGSRSGRFLILHWAAATQCHHPPPALQSAGFH